MSDILATACASAGSGITWPDVGMAAAIATAILAFAWLMLRD